ncbi:MAG: helix-turn-helix domain-containing protein [Oscillospiraceae bacterium]|nr:helix-turn-helix domain-containing protein [Oscillospiraceae bacterium]
MRQLKIGKFISEMRKQKGLTQSQLADILYVSDKAISKWETDKGFPEITTLVLLCNTLEININELLSGEIISDNDYKRKAEENMMLLISERENRRDKTILGILESKEISQRLEDNKLAASDFDEPIKIMSEISECAMNNGLLEIRRYLDLPNISGFLKDLIKLSTTDTIVPAEELFELFAVRIRLSTLTCKEIIENIIYLQGYMCILQGDTCDMVRQKLLLLIKDIQ